MSSKTRAYGQHRREEQTNSRLIAAILMMVLVAVVVAMAPAEWAAAGLVGLMLFLLVSVKPAAGLALVALSIPFGDAMRLPGGANLVDAAVALVVVGWLTRGVAERRIFFRRPPLTWVLLAFAWCLALSLTQASSWREGLPEWLKWGEFVALYLVGTQILDRDSVRWVLGALFAAGLLEVALGAYQFFRQAGPEAFILQGRFLRAFGTFRQPNPYAGYLGYLAPVAASLSLGALERWWTQRRKAHLAAGAICGCVAGALAAGIIMSWSRGGWLGLAAGIAAVIGLRSRRSAAIAAVGLAVLVLLIITAGAGWLPHPIADRLGDLGSYMVGPDPAHTEITDANFSVLERLAHWQAGARMFSEHPWLGVGIGNYGLNYAAYAPPHWYVSLGHAHNIFLHFLAETGVIGFTAFMVFWLAGAWLSIRIALRAQGCRKALAIGVLGTWFYITVHSMFDNLFVSHIQLQLALLLGALVVMDQYPMRPETYSLRQTWLET